MTFYNKLSTEGNRQKNGNAFACAVCGEPITPKRGSRRQHFCGYRCRDKARRERNFAASAGTRSAIPRSVENSQVNSKACDGKKVDRTSPLNVLGGHSWPHAITVERGLIDRIVAVEIGGWL